MTKSRRQTIFLCRRYGTRNRQSPVRTWSLDHYSAVIKLSICETIRWKITLLLDHLRVRRGRSQNSSNRCYQKVKIVEMRWMDYAITRNTTHSRVCARLLSFHPEMFGNLHFLRVCKQLGNYFCYLTIRESRLRHDLCNIELIRRRSRSDKICDSSHNNPDQARTVLTPVTTHH
jgi:hypothetical protein